MPRPWTEKMEDFAAYVPGVLYTLVVMEVEKLREISTMRVTLEHAEPEYAGRRHVLDLPLPIRPAGRTAEFLKACGINLAVGEVVHPKACVGRMIRTRFQAAEPGSWRLVAFEAPDLERPDEQRSA